jgi:hypothetical protein
VAVRFTASGQQYTRTTGSFHGNLAFTVTLWAILDADRNTSFAIWGQRLSTGNAYGYLYNETGDGTTMDWEVYKLDQGLTKLTGPNMAVGTPYFLAFGCGPAGASGVFLRYAAAGAAALTSVTGAHSHTSTTYEQAMLGNNQFDTANGWMDGRVAAVKEWSAVLSLAEIEAERWTMTPRRLANLAAWFPLLQGGAVAEAQNDRSGNGRHWTAGTGSTTEDGPPIMWSTRASRLLVPTGASPFPPPVYVFPPWIKV